jgi:hypothetical protein
MVLLHNLQLVTPPLSNLPRAVHGEYDMDRAWYTSIMPALRRLRQKDLQFEVILGYAERICPQKPMCDVAETEGSKNFWVLLTTAS